MECEQDRWSRARHQYRGDLRKVTTQEVDDNIGKKTF